MKRSGTKMMRRFIFLAVMLVAFLSAHTQSGKIPPFKILQSNGKVFSAQQLPIGKPIIIIYFDPDCDHCEKLVKELVARQTDFKKASIAMITFTPVETMLRFEKQYQLAKLNNIYVGTEGSTFFVRDYYRITTMPFMALYTKNGDLVKQYPNEKGLNDLSLQLQHL